MNTINVVVKALVMLILRFYKRVVSPVLPRSCRFYPTCSEYTMQAVEHYGVLKGLWMGIQRIGRCHPWNPGGYDPVPLPEHQHQHKQANSCSH